MDKYTIISLIAPLIAPLAPATVLINTLYLAMMDMKVDKNIALFAASASGVGAELSGMVAAYVAVQAYRKGKSGHFWLGLLAFGLYIIFIAAGVATGHNPAPLVITVLISIIAYLASAVLEDLFREKTENETVSTQDLERQKLSIAQTKANAEIERAKARQIEAGGSVNPGSVGSVNPEPGEHRTTQRKLRVMDYISTFFGENARPPKLAEIMEACEVGKGTASEWRSEWAEQTGIDLKKYSKENN